jgi:hypothetical protein
MPAIRPEAISNRVRLSYEIRAAIRSFIAEDGTVNALLSAVVDELSPDKHGVGALGSKHDLFSWPNELSALSSVGVSVGAVMSFVQFKAITISVLC